MAYALKTNIANKKNYGGKRATSTIKWIVIHFTANDGDHDESNGNYFKNNIVNASAHYFVDDDSVTQSVPDDYIAWSVGGEKYPSCGATGGGKYHNQCTNTNSISIELCDVNKNGVIYPSDKTIANAIELTKKLMKKYNIPASKVIRHFDVVGKMCPAYWCGTDAKNKKWKTEFHNKLTTSSTSTTTPTTNKSSYFKKYTGTSTSLVVGLEMVGAKSSYTYRVKIAKANGIANYQGTATQNTKLLNLLKKGKLLKP